MKSYLFALISLFLVSEVSYAQDAKKSLKTAQKDLAKYYQDQRGNADKLTSSLDLVTKAFEDPTIQADPESWVVKAEIYNTIADSEIKQKVFNPTYAVKKPDAAAIAFEAIQKAVELSPKKMKNAYSALSETEGHLNNMGISAFQAEDYKTAYTQFKYGLMSYEMLKANGQKSRLDEDTVRSEHKYFTAVSGFYGQVGEELIPLLIDIQKEGTDKPFIYEALFTLLSEKDESNALKYISEGRKKFPEDSGLLFAEINYYLKKNKLDELIDKLKLAIAAEPTNVSVYVTLGNVFDQLILKEKEAGNMPKSMEYFNEAKNYYGQALKLDDKNFDATYSIGALYYNQAAALTEKINALSNDYSSEGTKKYNLAKKEMEDLFLLALPYFEKAETLNGSDVNTLIALKEIYARQGKFDKSNEYKAKIENMPDK